MLKHKPQRPVKKCKRMPLFFYNLWKPSSSSEANNQHCDSQCTSDGCWGPGDNNCLHCANFHLNNKICLQDCSSGHDSNLYQATSKECKLCHSECKDGCFGAVSELMAFVRKLAQNMLYRYFILSGVKWNIHAPQTGFIITCRIWPSGEPFISYRHKTKIYNSLIYEQ